MQEKINKSRALDNFRTILRLRTVSYPEAEKERTDEEAFRRLRQELKNRYPSVFSKSELIPAAESGLLIRIPGRGDEAPSVLMAHMDVVEADPACWRFDPFAAEMADGRVWGRGSLDTKCTLCAILEAADFHLRQGYVPDSDLYLAFGSEEEVSGKCCPDMVRTLAERGVRPAFVLDEGGSVIPEGLPGLKAQAAVIGVAEKGVATYELSIRGGRGGHASVPPKSTVIGRLARAAERIEAHPFPARLSSAVQLMFRELAGEVPFYEKPVFAHPELAAPAVSAAASVLGGTFNAMVRTTCAITEIRGGSGHNVLPEDASMMVNVRLLEGDTVESVRRQLKKLGADPDLEVRLVGGSDPTGVSAIGTPGYEKLKETIHEVWPGTVAAPYQMNGGTDARFYQPLTDCIYRFSPMIMTREERASVHGINESISVANFFTLIRFYIKLMEKL